MREFFADRRRVYMLIIVAAITSLLLFLIFFNNRQPADPGVNYSVDDINNQTQVLVESELDEETRRRIEAQVQSNQPGKQVEIEEAAPYSEEAAEINNIRIPNPEEIDPSTLYPDPKAVDGPTYDNP